MAPPQHPRSIPTAPRTTEWLPFVAIPIAAPSGHVHPTTIYYRHTSYRRTSHGRAFRRRASHGRALSTEMHGGTSGRKKEWSLLIYGRRYGGLYTPRCSPAACTAAYSADLRPVLPRHMFHPGYACLALAYL